MKPAFVFVIALGLAVCLAACSGSSSGQAAPTTSSTPRSSTSEHGSSVPTTTRRVTTTTGVNQIVADQFAQLALTTAMNAAKSIYDQNFDFTSVTPASLRPLVPSLQFGTISQVNDKIVGVYAQDRNDVLLVARSASGRWYCVIDNAMDGLSYGEGSTRQSVGSNGECQQAAWPPPGQNSNPF